jgi:hypothetical protein
MQMMLNMIAPRDDRSAATQRRLQVLARSLSGPRPVGLERQGASVRGWTAGLNHLGYGPYRLVGEASLEAAMRTAARAIRMTGRPVGLLVWRGRHAWVMSGFRATADPAVTDRFEVTAAYVLDPLYPNGSKIWAEPAPCDPVDGSGASSWPGAAGRRESLADLNLAGSGCSCCRSPRATSRPRSEWPIRVSES